jgi:predicted Zn-dependent protease
MILASSAFQAISTPDGNIYVTMGCLESLESGDEVAAILAHELSHILLAHHTSDLITNMQKKGQTLYELGVSAKTAMSASKTTSKSDAHNIANEQLIGDVTDKLAMPAWGRRQEREADLLGIDLLIRAGYSPGAMISMLEKLQAWEKQSGGTEDAFWERLRQTAMTNPGEAMTLAYQRGIEVVSVNHPKTEDRISDSAEYLDRHYADLKPRELQVSSWKALKARTDVAQVMRHYRLAFSAKGMLDKGKNQDAYASARESATAPTATDAYPNWVVFRSAAALGHRQEAIGALQRAIASPEPVPQIYDDLILVYENSGNIATALSWTDRATTAFGGTPRWMPTKIRLLRKAGRTGDAEALNVKCALDAPDLKRQCQSANQTPAGKPSH